MLLITRKYALNDHVTIASNTTSIKKQHNVLINKSLHISHSLIFTLRFKVPEKNANLMILFVKYLINNYLCTDF